tara:strand:+ start:942 stop:2144 length:1203 start_codon:yes stop_codon:yes gene_type:complete
MEEEKIEGVEEVQQAEETKQEEDLSMFETADDPSVIKVNLDKQKKQDADTEQSTDEVPVRDESEASKKDDGQNVEEQKEESTGEEGIQNDQPVIEEVTNEEVEEKVEELIEEVEEAVAVSEQTGKPLPENLQKLVEFMEETGGNLEDYVRLNQDYSKMDNLTVLQEYYKITKPHLDAEERAFLMEESFNYDKELEDEKDIRKKKIALKEQVAEAKAYLDGQKSKYYEEIKAGSNLTKEQQKAINFFNRYNKESEDSRKKQKTATDVFMQKTNKVFNDDFKGFEYNVGDKKYRVNVKNAEKVKSAQTDINNFIKKFLNEQGTMNDAAGYHKSLYTAMNADAVAKHFYEQGKADAIKDSVAKAKNVDMSPRQTIQNVNDSDIKVRVLGSETSGAKFKFKKRK